MRDKNGVQLMAVWRFWDGIGDGFVVAPTRKGASDIIGKSPNSFTRVKGVYATGKPREL